MTTLFVAADGLSSEEGETRNILWGLVGAGLQFGIKVNLDYILQHGYARAFSDLRVYDRQLFVDLKMWNGKRTMVDVAKAMVGHEVDFFNIYALADSEIPPVIEVTRGTKTKVLAVTVLTHYDDAYCQRHFQRSLWEAVRHFGETAVELGCDGIILPGTVLDAVAHLDTVKVVPGVRPLWYKDTRHSEEIEPSVAKKKGADIVVCGSPIMKSDDPAAAMKRILQELQ